MLKTLFEVLMVGNTRITEFRDVTSSGLMDRHKCFLGN